MRPGRFDRQVVVSTPDVVGREAILKVHSKGKPLAPDVDLSVIAKTTIGFSGAELENLMNEAALLAARKGENAITMQNIEESIMKVIAGPEKKSRKVTEHEEKTDCLSRSGTCGCFKNASDSESCSSGFNYPARQSRRLYYVSS